MDAMDLILSLEPHTEKLKKENAELVKECVDTRLTLKNAEKENRRLRERVFELEKLRKISNENAQDINTRATATAKKRKLANDEEQIDSKRHKTNDETHLHKEKWWSYSMRYRHDLAIFASYQMNHKSRVNILNKQN